MKTFLSTKQQQSRPDRLPGKKNGFSPLFKSIYLFGAFLFLSFILACPALANFEAIGPFSVDSRPDKTYVVTDGIGRNLYLVPRGQKPPAGVNPAHVVRIPVKSVATDSKRDTSLFVALGTIDAVKAVVGKPKDWTIEKIKKGLQDGSVVSLGLSHGLDYERLAKARPDVFFTWDESLVPIMEEFGIPTVITNTDTARDLDTQIRFVYFLAPFFNEFKKADQYVARVYKALEDIKAKTANVKKKPTVIWGDVYSKRVLVEPGNSWAAQIVEASGGEYLFSDVSGDT
ncbi:ABC transporter substrate-binding protein [Dethiosulfatarculus sandiegensis]|uniref:ABC transporter substrate-binding protein n=1 Tax=Dethiosulfatarculus sandiegensis TaxID=1429043 RepID=UPI00069635D7|nr:ABC transporter substrate-binding protein [Dethiosulfatarculus sandiegensis]